MQDDVNMNSVIYSLVNNDKKALDKLFTYYYPRLYHFSKSYLKSEDGIEDILQEVFIKIWKNRANIRSSATFTPYVYTITRNLLLNELRRLRNKQKLKDNIYKSSVLEEHRSYSIIEYLELEKAVGQLINKLPEKQRNVFSLSRRKGLSNKDISQELEISKKTVEYHISHSIRVIKSELYKLGLMTLLHFCLL